MAEESISAEKIENNKKEILDLLSTVSRPGIENLVKFLNNTDFFTAPASTRYHESYVGGLADHSLKVFHVLDKLMKHMHPETYNDLMQSMILTAICHDLCKINCYSVEQRNRKVNGKWEQYNAFAYNDTTPLATHGPKSVIILQKFIPLLAHEVMAISWHSGSFGLSSNDSSSMMTACKQHPLVLMLHMADMMSVSGYKP